MIVVKRFAITLFLSMAGLGTVHAEYSLNMPKGVTRISQDVYDLHMLILWICVVIGLLVFGAMFYSIYHHRQSKGHVAVPFHENAKIEMLWTIIPFIILIGMAIPATKTMIDMDDTSEADMSIKVTGYQWKWKYEYLDEDISFFSTLDEKSNQARQLNSGIDPKTVPNYLLDVDKPLVVPINKKIRFLLTAADVLHSWWVPSFGWKKDTVPGFINEAWTNIKKPGIYRGQCAELCGKDHAFMPIVVIAKEQADYEKWVETQIASTSEEAKSADKEWSDDDLQEKGKAVYLANCASCHMESGEGMPGTFPALAGSSVVTGDIDTQVDVVVNGKGAMMPAFNQMLSASDLAAVITYTRNALGNEMNDSVQPSAIQELLDK